MIKDKVDRLLETQVYNPIFNPIEDAIFDVLGIERNILGNTTKTKIYAYSRIIFAYICRQKGLTLEAIANRINKTHATIVYYLKQYENNYTYDKVFICLSDAVFKRLKEIENGK